MGLTERSSLHISSWFDAAVKSTRREKTQRGHTKQRDGGGIVSVQPF